MPLGRCTAGIAVFALLISPASLPAQNGAAKSARTITPVRASEKVILDGVLNDRVWETALPATEFTQRDPDEGKPATERTELRVAYDDFNIYFGVRLFDTVCDPRHQQTFHSPCERHISRPPCLLVHTVIQFTFLPLDCLSAVV
jgi:hypothetical protein